MDPINPFYLSTFLDLGTNWTEQAPVKESINQIFRGLIFYSSKKLF